MQAKKIFTFLIPVPLSGLMIAPVLSSEGRFSRALLSGTERKLGRGGVTQAGRMRRPRLCLASADSEAEGLSSGPIKRLCQRCWLGEGQAAAGNRRAARQPSPRKNDPLATNPAMERPKGVSVASGLRGSEIMLRTLLPRRAFRRSVSPQKGEIN